MQNARNRARQAPHLATVGRASHPGLSILLASVTLVDLVLFRGSFSHCLALYSRGFFFPQENLTLNNLQGKKRKEALFSLLWPREKGGWGGTDSPRKRQLWIGHWSSRDSDSSLGMGMKGLITPLSLESDSRYKAGLIQAHTQCFFSKR